MAIVQRGNRQKTVSENDVERYLALGYDEVDSKGKIKQTATAGKSIPATTHEAEVKELRETIKKLEAKLKKQDKKDEQSAE